jgi:hypothetical protein
MACKVTKRDPALASRRVDAGTAPPGQFPTTSTPAPTAAEWKDAAPVQIPDSDAPCAAARVRDWLRVACPAKGRPIDGVQLNHSRGWGADVTTEDTANLASVVLPVRRGGDINVTFLLPDGARDLWVLWTNGTAQPSISFKKSSSQEKLRCTAPSRAGPCCYRAFSGTSFHAEGLCDRTRYQDACTSDADCDSRTKRVCRPGPPGTGLRLCTPQ